MEMDTAIDSPGGYGDVVRGPKKTASGRQKQQKPNHLNISHIVF